MKTGLLDYKASDSDIQLRDVWDHDVLPTKAVRGAFGPQGAIDFEMLGNDRWGDCFWASAAHETQVLAYYGAHRPVAFSDRSVLDSYEDYLGVHGLTEADDRGTDPTSGARYRRRWGIKDVNGKPHRIGAFVFDNSTDIDHIAKMIKTFGAVEFCVELPRSAEETFDVGLWDYDQDSPIEGGHAISGIGRAASGNIVIVSWGKEVEVTSAFLRHYLQTTIVYFSASVLDSDKQFAGLDKNALLEQLADVTG